MKRLFTIAVLTVSLLTLLAACGGEATPTATPGLAQPTAQELKQAAQELWDTFSASTQTRDGAAALHGIFISSSALAVEPIAVFAEVLVYKRILKEEAWPHR